MTTGTGSVEQQPGLDAAALAARVTELEAEIAWLRDDVERRDAALAALGERLLPVDRDRDRELRADLDRRLVWDRRLARLKGTRLWRVARVARRVYDRLRAGMF